MKFREIFRFELAYQGRRAWPWLIAVALLVVSFLMTRDGMLAEALYEEFFVNSPFAVAKTTVVGILIWLLVAPVVAGEAGARDVATGMHPLLWSAPVGRSAYLGGRFLAAMALNALLLLVVQVGILLAVYTPGVDAELIGPFRPAAYLAAFAYLALPTAFAATAIQFGFAVRSGRTMAGYGGSMLLLFIAYFVASLVLLNQGPGQVLDPIGIHFVLSDLSHDWTTVEKSHRLLTLEGTVLANRALWLSVGLVALAATWLRFRFEHRTGRRAWWRRLAGRRPPHAAAPASAHAPGVAVAATGPISVPRAARTFGLAADARRTLAIARQSFRATARSKPGLALLVGIPLMTVLVVLDQMVALGTPLSPETVLVIGELTGPLSAGLSRWVIVPLFLVYFAGELVWRERDAGMGEITDSVQGSEWAPLLGKFLGLGLLLALFAALLAAAGMLAQVILGHTELQPGLYATVMVGFQLPEYLMFAMLALASHVVVDHKYVGHLAAVMAYVLIVLAPMLGLQHDLLVYGAGPGWVYTEMRGFGPTLEPWLWFKLYWAAWAIVLAVVARLFWVRGRERSPRSRLRNARRRLAGPTAAVAAAAPALVLVLGGYVFYNTNVLNEYRSAEEVAELQAEYERRYGRYADAPQPELTATSLNVEIYPERREVEIRGSYRLVNRTGATIDSVHLTLDPEVTTRALAFDRRAALAHADEELSYRIYALEEPLRPGDSLRLEFDVRVDSRGFGESGAEPALAENGTWFDAAQWLPAVGYQTGHELTNPADRREYGLPAKPLIPSLYDEDAQWHRSAGIEFDAAVGTSAGQVAVAPGALRSAWTENGRRYFRYSSEEPIGGEWTIASADYDVREARWEGAGEPGSEVAIRVFHHPEHTGHLDRMVRGIRASLDYYTTHFGPYPYGHISFVELPANGTGMHAAPGMITFTSGASYWKPKEDPRGLDMSFAVTAHEMAHQWNVPSAYVEGAPVMSESLAWYYAMRVVEATLGLEQLERLRSFMRLPYPIKPIRRGEPLLRGLDPWMSYRKGPYALHALSEYVGVEPVNTALRRLGEKHEPPDAPLATTLDLYRELEAVTPDSLGYLLHDLFEVNAFWELSAESATAERTADGAWEVTLEVLAKKVVADSAGAETEVPLDEWVPIGVFGAWEASTGAPRRLYLERHRIRSGEQTITVTVPEEPVFAGVDPLHVLDWEQSEDDDNLEAVTVAR